MTNTAPHTRTLARRAILVLLIATWLAAFTATHLPPSKIPDTGMGDVTLHTIGYFGLASLFVLTLASRRARRAWRVPLTLCAFAVYGVLDELTQAWVNRRPAATDWLADMAGTVLAVLVWELLLLLIVGKSARPSKPTP
jgi:VanZ family protein